MDLFNSLIKETNELLNGITPKSYPYIPSKAWKDIGSNELVLSRDAAFELGASGKGSANYVLFTSSGDLVEKDEICVYGRDINAISSDSDFARIVILRVGALEMEDEAVYRTLKDIEFSKYHVYPEGYMVRMSSENFREQVRISKQAVRRGISFEALGNNYITEYKKNLNVLAVKVMFITDPAPDYRKMQEIAKKSKDVTETLTHIFEGLSTDCSVCSLKDVCDEVEGMKELHFGIGAKGIKH